MMHDPRKKLWELEVQELSSEGNRNDSMLNEQEFSALYDEILKELDSRDDDLPIRNFANDYGRKCPAPPLPPVHADVTAEEPWEEPRVRGNGCLIFLLILELLAIVGVIGFWILFLIG